MTARGFGVTERGRGVTDAGVTARGTDMTGLGVIERALGTASGKPLRDEGGLMLAGATGKLTLGKVELRVGTGRCWATEPSARTRGRKKAAISAWLATRSRATIAIAVASSAQSEKR